MKTPFQFLCSLPARAARFLRNCWTECPKHEKCSMLAMSALLNLFLGFALLSGCASTSKGVAREQTVYNAATNVVGVAQQVAPFLPAPVSAPLGAILGGISAALAAWNIHQQRTLSALKKAATQATVNAQFTQARTVAALDTAKQAVAQVSQATAPPPAPGFSGTAAPGASPAP